MPRALVLRVIRNLDVAATIMDSADRRQLSSLKIGRAGVEQLAKTFRGDASLLRILISFSAEEPGADQ